MPQVDINTLLGEVLATQRTGGGASVIDAITQVNGEGVIPTIDGKPAGLIRVVGGGSDVIESTRWTYNPGTDVPENVAAQRLTSSFVDTLIVGADSEGVIAVREVPTSPITNLFLLVTGTSVADGVTLLDGTAVGDVVVYNESAVDVLTNSSLVHLEFPSASNVLTVFIGVQLFNDGDDCEIYVRGVSNA